MLPTLDEIRSAAALVHAAMPPTPQYCWPLLCKRVGTEVWVKHENHTPIGAFKVRGGLVYVDALRRDEPAARGVLAATRGNHGQSIAYAAKRAGMDCVIVVPHGNSREKNAAIGALGAELIEHGNDFQAAYEFAMGLATERKLHPVLSFHPLLVRGVASYALEFLEAVPDLDRVYVPIGLGSGICGAIAVRDALGLRTEIVGVVAAEAPAYALSFTAGKAVATSSAETIADGIACRTPAEEAVGVVNAGAARVVTVEEGEIKEAMRALFAATHNVAEGAGAVALAALLKERAQARSKRVGVVLSGGNVDSDVFAAVLHGDPLRSRASGEI